MPKYGNLEGSGTLIFCKIKSDSSSFKPQMKATDPFSESFEASLLESPLNSLSPLHGYEYHFIVKISSQYLSPTAGLQ